MKITAENDLCISVDLTGDDMQRLDITYEALDYSNIETRRVLWTLLDEARRVAGTNISLSDRLIIETVPKEKGGCRITFTSVPDEKGGRLQWRGQAKQMLLAFDSAEQLLAFCAKVPQAYLGKEAALYEKDGQYRILANPPGENRERLAAMAEEFGTDMSATSVFLGAQTREYWQLVSSHLSDIIQKQ